ncbi:MAG: HEAT repeat domain-containing protein [Spirulina sp. SIO3F2]|nr:HEAT repeat domain-containing protein [Spirulina sp. SIO3F2]
MSPTPESVQSLLQSQDYGDRIKGLNALRQLPVDQAYPLLKPLITDEFARIRYAAVSQLDQVGHHNPTETLALLRDRLFNDSEIDVQAAAADAIAALKFTEAFDDLKQAYEQTSEWLLQFSIVAALGEMGDPRAFELLCNALESDNGLLQTAAISALGELGDPKAIPLLIPFVEDADWQVRQRLAQALANLGTPASRSPLQALSQDTIESVATEAQRGLASLS